MRVMPLGTSSGAPTPDRNVSGLAVDLGENWILVDCGEATQHTIQHTPLRPSRLAGVFITHLHGDHVLGLPGLLSSLSIGRRVAPLPITGPMGIKGWLDYMQTLPLLTLDFELQITELEESSQSRSLEFDPRLQREPDRLAAVEPVEVRLPGITVGALPLIHRVTSFGYRFTGDAPEPNADPALLANLGIEPGPAVGRLKAGESIQHNGRTVTPSEVLSGPSQPEVIAVMGDTVSCWNAVSLANGASLLVHESTYADEHSDLGARWTHSTSRQAAQVAARAGAERLLLTHFSSRYDTADLLVNQAREVFPATRPAVERTWFELTDWTELD